MKAWLREHVLALRDSLVRMGRTPLASLLSILVVALALLLPAMLHVALKNLAALAPDRGTDPQLTLYLKPDAADADRQAVEASLRRQTAIARFRFVPKDAALAELEKATGLASVVAELGRNPLPDAFVVTASPGNARVLETLQTEAGKWPGVEFAQLDSLWARQVDAALRAGRLLVLLLAAVLGVALAAVTFNTIRLQILNRREEIEVSKLIGATNAFIRRPFLYFGALQALLGAWLAWALVEGALRLIEAQMGQAAVALVSPGAVLLGPGLPEILLATPVAGALGWSGAWLSVAFHLRQFDPR